MIADGHMPVDSISNDIYIYIRNNNIMGDVNTPHGSHHYQVNPPINLIKCTLQMLHDSYHQPEATIIIYCSTIIYCYYGVFPH